MICIYKIVSPSGKFYIVQTWNFQKQKNLYKNLRCEHQRKLYRSLCKYGFDAHHLDILEVLDKPTQEDLDQKEIFYFEYFKNQGLPTINLKLCGNGGGKHSEETRKLMSVANKNNRPKPKEGHAILQYSLDFELIKRWERPYDTRTELGYYNIGRRCNNAKLRAAYGYFWIFEKDMYKLNLKEQIKVKEYTNQSGKYFCIDRKIK